MPSPEDLDAPSDRGGSYSERHVHCVIAATDDTTTVGNTWGGSSTDLTMTRDQFDEYFDDARAFERPDS